MPRQIVVRAKTRRSPRRKRSHAPLGLALLAAAGAAALGAGAFYAGEFEGEVTRIVDGDTFYVAGQDMRIRLWGLDAPETNAPGGAAATSALEKIAHGKRVACRTIDIDRYRRPVARCHLEDGRDVAALMIESGTAKEFLRYSGGYYSAGDR